MARSSRQRLDFRTKLLMTCVLSYTLLLGNLQQRYLPVAIAASILPYLLLLSAHHYRQALSGGAFILLAAIVQKFLLYEAKGLLVSFFLFMTMLFLRLLPGITMGRYTLMTTDMSELVCSLKKLKAPDQIVIPITVMARFFYTVKEDYNQIKDAMYLHGLTTGRLILKPMKLFEYRTVPLLMCLSRTADEVGISALSRGLEVGAQRTSISTSRIKGIDYLFFLLALILIGFYISGKYA